MFRRFIIDIIEGKVAKIIDLYTIVINKGSEHGVEEDMRFVIYEIGEEINDPDSGESLGKLEYIKAKVKVTHVIDKFSIAECYEAHSPYHELAERIMVQTIVRKKLPLDEKAEKILQYHTISNVKKGDTIKQVLD